MKDEAEAEDVVQIVFLDIFRNVAKFDASRGTLKMRVLQYAYSPSVNRRRQLESRHFYPNVELDDVDPANLPTSRSPPAASTGTFTLNEAIEGDAQFSRQRLFSILFDVFSAMALALALVGIFSVVAYSLAQRTTEFGVQLALGAPRPARPVDRRAHRARQRGRGRRHRSCL